jgi:hypothetical protein
MTAQQQSTEAAPAAENSGIPRYEKKFPFDAPPPKDGDYIDMFCRGTNDLMKKTVVQSFRDKVEMKPAGTAGPELIDRLLAAPEFPGMSRPLWMVMAGSIPTALGWYGYYKFSVEEELFQVRRLLGQKGSLGGWFGLKSRVLMRRERRSCSCVTASRSARARTLESILVRVLAGGTDD